MLWPPKLLLSICQSERTGCHPPRSLDVQDTCLHRMNKFCLAFVCLKCHFSLFHNVWSDTVKITSAPGPGPLSLNWNMWEWLRMNQEWTSQEWDLDWSLTNIVVISHFPYLLMMKMENKNHKIWSLFFCIFVCKSWPQSPESMKNQETQFFGMGLPQ